MYNLTLYRKLKVHYFLLRISHSDISTMDWIQPVFLHVKKQGGVRFDHHEGYAGGNGTCMLDEGCSKKGNWE